MTNRRVSFVLLLCALGASSAFAASPPPQDPNAKFGFHVVINPVRDMYSLHPENKILDSEKDGIAALDPFLTDPKNKQFTVVISRLADVLDKQFDLLQAESKYTRDLERVRTACKLPAGPLLEYKAQINLPNQLNTYVAWIDSPNTNYPFGEFTCDPSQAKCTGSYATYLLDGNQKEFDHQAKAFRAQVMENVSERAKNCETAAAAETARIAREGELNKNVDAAATSIMDRLKRSGAPDGAAAPKGNDPACQKSPAPVSCYK